MTLLTRAAGIAAVAAALAAPLWLGSATAQDAPAVANAPAAKVQIVDMAMGKADAPVTVIEYASFTCPHCAAFEAEVFPEIKKAYIDTGKVRFILREVYFDRYGLWASMVARCGGEMRFFGVAEMLFKDQKQWLNGQDPAATAENLRKIGRSAGMTDAELNACLSDEATATALVDWYNANQVRDGIEATPSFIINGEKVSNMSYAEFAKVLDGKLE